ncbi:2-oxoglutarate dehydrogenase complex dihydrolipoyllysine-residue succinyltransferase [Cytophaga hutchinsonii]|uniref:Dihydrolipoyllysine-residue succinyltransferase component of 2-oxoglutarate dehydrogenase complex n=1 Tax=Cytophaga hutchinsonii (strain ATCC 33406 / DSM 1761 / CIP 103989 / NBRC 15051 / NCIMB 9469 / D465) TaxID=269798 RepID=A0A6N4SWC5_CYTH3|nr:2-oxoglutarate dehydrogenase complex dihydrolipoyllysine-residue succinyltransferase [Cytophaga hutchinsonii]ABG60597.1 2-oxoglutarate dehydrogenase E2 component [Cytophaga hutchinsonii ATCC 33406]SFX89253.1 2-oxoglutarate dehydrogenase E2 component [Cytophaga hutchinsonii ATCC 33406]
MAFEVKVPTVGESITEVTIGRWNKKDGEFVDVNELICEIESDKATFELNAEKSGILKLNAKEGDTVAIGTVICSIEEGAGSAAAKPAANAAPAAAPAATPAAPAPAASNAAPVEVKIPTVGESITEVTLGAWSVKSGDAVKAGDLLLEIESDKATFELHAETTGTIEILSKSGDTVAIGTVVCKIVPGAGGASQAAAPASAPAATAAASSGGANYAGGHASPAAGKILNEKGVDASAVAGSGKDGRITKEDALKASAAPAAAAKPAAAASTAAPAAKASAAGRADDRVKMTSLRKTIARRLVAVKNETAMLTTFNEVDMKPVMDMRSKYKDTFKEKYGIGLGFMSFFTKAVCMALQEFPAVNAYIDGDEIVYHNFCDVSVAVSTPKGLVVPVIRNAETMSFNEIEAEIVRLATRARDGKLSIDEMSGGTFTITNGGIFGSMLSTPIINSPQSAILGMHNIVERPVAVGGQVVIRPIMYLALSYDHRIIDGRESVGFLVRVKQLLEDPSRLLLGV